jgi:hypothetical protein
MVELANKTGSNPWFKMPHDATDDYIQKFATYVCNHLDPRLIASVEYCDLGRCAQLSTEAIGWSIPPNRNLPQGEDNAG